MEKAFGLFAKITYKSMFMIFIFFFIMLFYACLGQLIYYGDVLDTDIASLTEDIPDNFFDHFGNAYFELFYTMTTANYPDVQMPYIEQNRWSAIYFDSFLIIEYMFILNVIIAIVFEEYRY